MSKVSDSFARFETAYTALLEAAADVRRTVAAEAGVRADDPCAVVLEIVARHYGYTVEVVLSRDRTRDVAFARQVAMWLCRALTRKSLQSIGERFGRDHGTVICAIRAVGDRAATTPHFASELLDLRHRCERTLGDHLSDL